jgi:ubiquinone/menaquinone biosynthesis C-methylase UbiE
MVAQGIRQALSRRVFVESRMWRTLALRTAYVGYARALLRQVARSDKTAAESLRSRVQQLFEEDWQDAADGVYPFSLVEALPWGEYARALPRLLADLPRTRARILNERWRELPDESAPERYPRYYARNFHYQSEGYLGHTSAALYDLQVELLFGGTADAMRRRLVKPLVQFARAQGASRSQPLRILDVACGTGHFLRMLGAALPGEARLFGLDLSPHYIARAREALPRELDVSLVCDNAEKLPFVDASFDAVCSVFLLHEVPGEVRARVLREMARVVRPGGLVVVGDSIQLADAPELHKEILAFPARFHEPYYETYVKGDLSQLLEQSGLQVTDSKLAFLTKFVSAQKPAA